MLLCTALATWLWARHARSAVAVGEVTACTGWRSAGTAAAALELVERAGATIAGCTVLLELSFLGGRRRRPGGTLRGVGPPYDAERAAALLRGRDVVGAERGGVRERPVAGRPPPR